MRVRGVSGRFRCRRAGSRRSRAATRRRRTARASRAWKPWRLSPSGPCSRPRARCSRCPASQGHGCDVGRTWRRNAARFKRTMASHSSYFMRCPCDLCDFMSISMLFPSVSISISIDNSIYNSIGSRAHALPTAPPLCAGMPGRGTKGLRPPALEPTAAHGTAGGEPQPLLGAALLGAHALGLVALGVRHIMDLRQYL